MKILKNMKYYIFALIAILLIVFGIWMIRNKDSSETDKKENDNIEETVSGDGVIVWSIPFHGALKENDIFVEKLNEQLKKDGYSFSVMFKTLEAYTSSYRENLEAVLSSGETDIANTGFYEDLSQVQSIIRKGYFEELNDYLFSEKGEQLYNAFDKALWKGVETDGKIYTIPNSTLVDGLLGVAFNKEFIPEELAKSFTGDFGDLLRFINEDILKDEDIIPIIICYHKFQFSNVLGYDYRYGVFLDCRTGEVKNPYDTEELYNFFSALHKMYKNGYLSKGNSFINEGDISLVRKKIDDLDFAIMHPIFNLDDGLHDKVTIYRMPFYMISRLPGSTGIAKNSKNKEAALQLLTLLHTDEKYANLLVYGEEGIDYKLIDGLVYNMDESPKGGYKSALGLYDTLYPTEGEYFMKNRKQQKYDLYNSPQKHDSVLLGFQINADNFTAEMRQVESISEKYLDIWKEDNFVELYQEAREVVGEAAKELIEELERQIEEWKRLYAGK